MKYAFLALAAACFFFFFSLGANMGYLTNDDIELFYKQGFLIKRQCLSQDEISLLQENVTEAIERSLEAIQQSSPQEPSSKDQFLYIDGSRIVYKMHSDYSASIARINGAGGMQPELIKIIRSKKMLHTFFELLNTFDIEHLISQIHPKLPGDGIAFPRHQDIQFRKTFDPDWQDILGNGSYAICIIPVDPMNEANGGLWIDRNNYPEFLGMEEDRLWIEAEPGDLLFMHPYLFHGSGPNRSLHSRKTLLTGFCAFGANHKAYPGIDVNMRLTLNEDGSISTQKAPWNPCACGPDSNH